MCSKHIWLYKAKNTSKLPNLHKVKYLEGDLLKKKLYLRKEETYIRRQKKGTYKQNIFTTQNEITSKGVNYNKYSRFKM